MSIENFIDLIQSGDYRAAESEFNTELDGRVQDAIEAKRIDVGASISSAFSRSAEE